VFISFFVRLSSLQWNNEELRISYSHKHMTVIGFCSKTEICKKNNNLKWSRRIVCYNPHIRDRYESQNGYISLSLRPNWL